MKFVLQVEVTGHRGIPLRWRNAARFTLEREARAAARTKFWGSGRARLIERTMRAARPGEELGRNYYDETIIAEYEFAT